MEHQRVDPPPRQYTGHQPGDPAVTDPDRLRGRVARVRQRAEEVEGGRHTELTPRYGGMPQRGVERRGEAEGDPGLLPHLGHLCGGEVERNAELLEYVGRTARRRGRAVAVLEHLGSRAGRDDRRHRADVHGVGLVTAGPDDVQGPAGDRDPGGEVAHRRDQALDLGDRLALGTQRDRRTRRAGPATRRRTGSAPSPTRWRTRPGPRAGAAD